MVCSEIDRTPTDSRVAGPRVFTKHEQSYWGMSVTLQAQGLKIAQCPSGANSTAGKLVSMPWPKNLGPTFNNTVLAQATVPARPKRSLISETTCSTPEKSALCSAFCGAGAAVELSTSSANPVLGPVQKPRSVSGCAQNAS